MALASKPVYLFNSLSKEKEVFKALTLGRVSIYSCGLTVYDYGHIGNFRAFLFVDILVRTLKLNGYKTKFIQNITDVGHLVSDADEGPDKLQKRAEDTQMEVIKIVDRYTHAFLEDSKKLNLLSPDERPKASGFIKEQIEFIKELEDKGYTYKISDGVYFDTSKLDDYGKLVRLKKEGLTEGARVEKNTEKRNPTDFALWKFSPHDKKRYMEWPSPWGIGFPGWHIECSAIGKELLKFPFDIHTGGADHKPIHHTNEIAQNEALTGKSSVNYWLHNEFVVVDGKKMSKSFGNFITIKDIEDRGFSPLAFRYLVLNTHYRQKLNFNWDSLKSAQTSLSNLYEHAERISATKNTGFIKILQNFYAVRKWYGDFLKAVNDDLNTPKALAIMWELIKDDNINHALKRKLLVLFDIILGLGITDYLKREPIPEDIKHLVKEREEARSSKDWSKADELRAQIRARGYLLEDTDAGQRIIKKDM